MYCSSPALDIDPGLQYSLLEFVAHLTSENYEQLPEDLAALGFLKKDKVDYVKRTGILEPLKFFLNQAGKGGGANAVRDRIFDEYRTKYPGLTDDELRIEMRSEMKVRTYFVHSLLFEIILATKAFFSQHNHTNLSNEFPKWSRKRVLQQVSQ